MLPLLGVVLVARVRGRGVVTFGAARVATARLLGAVTALVEDRHLGERGAAAA